MTDVAQSDTNDTGDTEDECCPPIRTYEVETTREDQCCDEMYQFLTADDVPVTYFTIDREWGIAYPGDNSTLEIRFCPWCGTKFPEGLLDQRVTRLATLGLDLSEIEPDDPRIPAEFRSDRWWKAAGL